MICKKIPLDKLSSKDRVTALELMIDGINSGIEKMVRAKAHILFVGSLHQGPEFSPEVVWNSLGDSSQSHFDHAKKAIDMLESLIDAELGGPGIKKAPVEPPPAPVQKSAVPKKSLKKKKR